ncbi:MAG: hypothetical protein ACR2H1_05265 [Limisphaerales bacterium]
MSCVYRIIALLMLALWLPVTGHCTLETIKGLEFLSCPSDTSSDSHCENDGCQSIESATYKVQDNHADFAVAISFLGCFVFQTAWTEPSVETFSVSSLTLNSPELPKTWQFILRTALSPRAPSLVS